MKRVLKTLGRKILFGNHTPRTFPALRISDGQIQEHVMLISGQQTSDISSHHAIVCHDPFCIAVMLHDANFASSDRVDMEIRTGNRLDASARVTHLKTLEGNLSGIHIFQVTHPQCFQTNTLHQYFLSRYFQNKNSLFTDKCYSVFYAYPRRVIAVSYQEDNYYNIFPMDFQCFLPNENLYLLGLRTTNITLAKILRTKKMVIADTFGASIETMYYLGSHHGTNPPVLEKLPFATLQSDLYHFPVPNFSAAYKEIEIVYHEKLGTHMFMIGNVVNARSLGVGGSSLYHTQFLQSLKSTYPTA